MDKPGSKDAVNILRRLKRSTQYRLIRRYISSDFVIDDFDQLLQQAPAEDRWAWWWHSYGRLISRRDSTGIQGLARELSEEYKSADQIKQFLIDVDSLIAPLNPWPNPPILQFWVDQNPEPFLALVQPNQWSSIPPRFQGQISTAIVKYDQNYVEMKCRDILEKLPDIPGNELHDFMTMVTVNRIPHELLRETFLEIAKRSNSPNRGYFIYQLYFYFEPTKDGSSYLRLICKATHDELTTAYCNHLAFSLHVLKKDWYISDAALLDKLRSKIKPLLKDLEKLDYHALEIVEFAYGSHLDEYVRFIEQRIDALKDGSEVEKSKRVIPYDGIPCIRNAITNQEQFNKFVEKIVEWNSTDSLGRFDVRHLLKPISDIKNDSQESMLALWIKSKLTVVNDQSFKDVVSLMQLLEFRQLDESSYLLLLETGNKVNLFKQAKGVFQWYLDSGAMKSRVGEVPEILNEKLDMCKRLIEQASPG